MDPGRSTQVLTVNYFVNLYDTLTRWDAALRLQPGLATSWRNLNDTTWELTLRPGVKFHDGSPLTAEDVKATLERNLLPGKTVVQAGFATMESIQAVTPTTVRIVTKKPDPLLLVRLAQMGAQILPARLTTDEGVKELARRPVGTGAYRFVEWVKDERLVMEANRDWWGWEGRPPAIDRVVWKPIPDDFPRIVALEKGEADIITNVPPDRMKALAEGTSTKILSTPATRTVTFWINTTQPPLSDKRVRQALHLAHALVGERRLGRVDPEGHGARRGRRQDLRAGPLGERLHPVGRDVGDDVGLPLLERDDAGEVVGDRLPDDPVDRRRPALPAPPVAVGLHHEPLVLHPLHEAVRARAHGPPRQLLHALLGREARREDLSSHLRQTHEQQRIGLLRHDTTGRRVRDLDRLDRREARRRDGPARNQVALERRPDVLRRQRHAVVELHPLAERELPRGVVHVLPGDREPGL